MLAEQLLLRPTAIGHALTIAHLDPKAVARFRSRIADVAPDTFTGCTYWPGARNSDGYGIVRVAPKSWGAVEMTSHRLAYLLAKGSLPPERELHHTCHMRACFRVDHLEPLTGPENMADLTPIGSDADRARYPFEIPF